MSVAFISILKEVKALLEKTNMNSSQKQIIKSIILDDGAKHSLETYDQFCELTVDLALLKPDTLLQIYDTILSL